MESADNDIFATSLQEDNFIEALKNRKVNIDYQRKLII